MRFPASSHRAFGEPRLPIWGGGVGDVRFLPSSRLAVQTFNISKPACYRALYNVETLRARN
jgi:hypothetical protein